MRPLGKALISYDCVLIKRGHLDSDIYTRRMPCEDEDRDWRDASTSQGALKIARKSLETRREA